MSEEQRTGLFKHMETKMLTKKVGRVEDVAEAYLGVMRDGNCTGSIVSTEGGYMLT
jgi:hypothetical protein